MTWHMHLYITIKTIQYATNIMHCYEYTKEDFCEIKYKVIREPRGGGEVKEM
jgi:hypothetical protein